MTEAETVAALTVCLETERELRKRAELAAERATAEKIGLERMLARAEQKLDRMRALAEDLPPKLTGATLVKQVIREALLGE